MVWVYRIVANVREKDLITGSISAKLVQGRGELLASHAVVTGK